MEHFRSVSLGVWVDVGSVCEDEKESGVSHFIEHMLFNGTEKRSAADIASEMDAVGGNDPDLFSIFDGIAHITREPLDALKQVVTQSWTYIGGFVVPTDITATPTTIPTASNARYKRGVILESL